MIPTPYFQVHGTIFTLPDGSHQTHDTQPITASSYHLCHKFADNALPLYLRVLAGALCVLPLVLMYILVAGGTDILRHPVAPQTTVKDHDGKYLLRRRWWKTTWHYGICSYFGW